ncbi:MAG: hypothetical protein ABF301_04640 [Sulfurovum sp.]|jgi:hypothetical protein|nr:MAG: Uncharacterised protein [Arcobacter lacus]
MTDSDNELKITRESFDSVSFKNAEEDDETWSKEENTVTEDGKEFDVYTNDDKSVQVKVQTDISDGITS